jgi:hypothetical protein
MCGKRLPLASGEASTGRPQNEVFAASASSSIEENWTTTNPTLWPSEASVSCARTVLVSFGKTWSLPMSMDRPTSIVPSATSVRWARLALGLRKVGTALAMASTPVSALQPEVKALISSRMPIWTPHWQPNAPAR